MMVGIFKSNIKKSLEEAIKKGLTEIVNKDLNDLIQKTPHIIPIKDKVNLNLAITEIGFKTNQYIYGAVVGAFYEEKVSISPLPDRPLNDRTGQVYVSPNMFKSAAETFVKAGILKATVNAEDVPPESPLKLNTKSLSNYIPELYSKWPDHDLQVKVEVKQVPTFDVSADGLFANLQSSFEMNVKTQDGFVKAFNADFTFNGGALLSMKEAGGRVYNLTGEVKKVVIGLKLKESFMGNVSLTRMEQFLNIVIVRGMIAAANRQLKQGYSLILPEVPDGFLIKNILVEYRPEFIAVSADAIFEENFYSMLNLFLEPKSMDISYLFKKVLSKFEFDYESAMNQVIEVLNKKE
jgi:lipopolysaccharide-binding protein